MKYVIVIADGAGDLPVPALGGKTPLEAARTPRLDAIAATGIVGRAVTTPPGFGAGSDVCSMSLLGYDPRTYHTGRAPLEAAALGLQLQETDWIFRLNFVTVDDGKMIDHSAGAITDAEARELAMALSLAWAEECPEIAKSCALTPGVSYRNILVDSSGTSYEGAKTTPPHEIPGQPFAAYLPEGPGAARIAKLMSVAARVLPGHPVNQMRVSSAKRPANMAWIWGQGVKPRMPSFMERFGLKGAMITPVDLLAGIAALMGWDRLNVPGVTSYHDNDYRGQGQAACAAIGGYDILCCHVESPDEASHQGDWKTKVAAIEAIDEFVVGPIAETLKKFGPDGSRLLVLPDHYTLVSTKKHDATPVPFLLAGKGFRDASSKRFIEREADRSAVCVDPGDALMDVFLGRRAVRA